MISSIVRRQWLRNLSKSSQLFPAYHKTPWPVQQRFYNQSEQNEPEEAPDSKRTSLRHIDEHFKNIPRENKTKASFLAAIDMFIKRSKNERGQVEFIHSALKHMKEYGLHKDIEVYKALLKVFPVGPLLPKNVWQKMFLHYPNHQNCCIKVLDNMEWNLVYPDMETFDIVKDRFGGWAFATKKIRRMMYWYPRLRYTNKYLDRKLQDNRYADVSFAELAKMGLEMMSRDKGAEITYSTVSDDKSLIVSSQSPLQRKLISKMDRAKSCFYINGPFLLYVAERKLHYVTFTTDPGPDSERLLDKFIDHEEIENVYATKFYEGLFVDEKPPECGTVHEQVDQTILALGVLQTINENSAFAWTNHLQTQNPTLKESTIILRFENAYKARKEKTENS